MNRRTPSPKAMSFSFLSSIWFVSSLRHNLMHYNDSLILFPVYFFKNILSIVFLSHIFGVDYLVDNFLLCNYLVDNCLLSLASYQSYYGNRYQTIMEESSRKCKSFC